MSSLLSLKVRQKSLHAVKDLGVGMKFYGWFLFIWCVSAVMLRLLSLRSRRRLELRKSLAPKPQKPQTLTPSCTSIPEPRLRLAGCRALADCTWRVSKMHGGRNEGTKCGTGATSVLNCALALLPLYHCTSISASATTTSTRPRRPATTTTRTRTSGGAGRGAGGAGGGGGRRRQ